MRAGAFLRIVSSLLLVLASMSTCIRAEDLSVRVRAGADWLLANQVDGGPFRYGWDPSLDRDLPESNPLRQSGALAALARSAAVLDDSELRRAALELLTDWIQKSTRTVDGRSRESRLPFHEANPLGLVGLNLWAIAETRHPTPALEQAGAEMVTAILGRQRADGSLRFGMSRDPRDDEGDEPEGLAYYPGEALTALASFEDPRGWEAVTRSLPYYRGYWRANPQPAFIPWQSIAHARLHERSGDQASAEFVFEMNDWLIRLQYQSGQAPDDWEGGFAPYANGEMLWLEPGVGSASYAESLVAAVQVARAMRDKQREQRYLIALDQAIQFLLPLQYREDQVAHFEPAYRRRLIGAFHASHSDGRVRIDFTQHALAAMGGVIALDDAPRKVSDSRPPTTIGGPRSAQHVHGISDPSGSRRIRLDLP